MESGLMVVLCDGTATGSPVVLIRDTVGKAPSGSCQVYPLHEPGSAHADRDHSDHRDRSHNHLTIYGYNSPRRDNRASHLAVFCTLPVTIPRYCFK